MDSQRSAIIINTNKKVYFASDQHFGAPTEEKSREREIKFVKWLDEIKADCGCLFLLGDLFDFWLEYRSVVPRGFVRVLGKLAEFTDDNIPIHFFVGNHDLWMKDYFQKELNIPVYFERKTFVINGNKCLIGHGDGLGPNDTNYKRMKKLFHHPVAQKLYSFLHPDIAVPFAQKMSLDNKMISGEDDAIFKGLDKENLVHYCRRKLQNNHYDFFIFGHRHLPLFVELKQNSVYINTGDWLKYNSYAVMYDSHIELKGNFTKEFRYRDIGVKTEQK